MNLAPFNRKSDGSPYLEVHHRKPLAEGGDDTVANAIALCPNCHRAAHYG
nr:HNH endonuclease signature motif containing protein [Halomonas meridiana]